MDMINFCPRESVPERFAHRTLHVHNPTVTLMRTTAEETAELGATIARKLAAATGPVEVFVPRRGVSAIAVAGAPFADADADAALFDALLSGLEGSRVTVHDVDAAINDEGFGRDAAEALHRLIQADRPRRGENGENG